MASKVGTTENLKSNSSYDIWSSCFDKTECGSGCSKCELMVGRVILWFIIILLIIWLIIFLAKPECVQTIGLLGSPTGVVSTAKSFLYALVITLILFLLIAVIYVIVC